MKKIVSLLLLINLLIIGCNSSSEKNPLEWADNAVLYEVNVRQYTPEGTFNAFAKHLPRLKKLGVDILWFMPIHPVGKKNRKGSLGSYYSIKDYKAINPEFGTMNDFKSLVKKAHKMGFKVLIDCVANHTSWDSNWIINHPDWFTHDSTGTIIPPVADWSDVADLNYDNENMRAAMLDALSFWVAETDIDGYRCDYAGGVPTDFWEEARTTLEKIKPVFMLAEDQDNLDLLNSAFNCNYGWTMHHTMNEIYSGEKTVVDIKNYFAQIDTTYPQGTYPVEFTSNHDENSWNGTAYERLGNAVKTFTVLSFTIAGMPLIYGGQEAGLNKRLAFFEKDEINWSDTTSMTKLYTALIKLKHNNKALWNGTAGAKIKFIKTSAQERLLAFKRQKGKNEVIVVMNLSEENQKGTVYFDEQKNYTEYFTNTKTTLTSNNNFEMTPWEYRIFVSK